MLGVETVFYENWLTIISFVLLVIVFFLLFLFIYWLVRQVIANERTYARKQEENMRDYTDRKIGRVFTNGGHSCRKKSK